MSKILRSEKYGKIEPNWEKVKKSKRTSRLERSCTEKCAQNQNHRAE